MMGFLPPAYSKIFKREKFTRRILKVFIFSSIVFFSGIIFLLPSYFTLVFSLNDVLRSLGAEEVTIKRRDVDGLESKISYANFLLDTYAVGESKRNSFSTILLTITNSVSGGIKLTGIEFKKSSGIEFVFHVRGEAEKRSDLIVFSQKLRQLDEIKELRSPVSNLLQDTNIKFLLEIVINSQYYGYKN